MKFQNWFFEQNSATMLIIGVVILCIGLFLLKFFNDLHEKKLKKKRCLEYEKKYVNKNYKVTADPAKNKKGEWIRHSPRGKIHYFINGVSVCGLDSVHKLQNTDIDENSKCKHCLKYCEKNNC